MTSQRTATRDGEVGCISIEWYGEGDTRIVEVAGVSIAVRFVGRKGRRGRIVIEAPAGAIVRSLETNKLQPLQGE